MTLRWGDYMDHLGGSNTIIRVLKLSQLWQLRHLQIGFCVLLTSPPHPASFWGQFLTFWHHEILQAYFVHFLPQPWNQPFFQGAPVPLIKE